MESECVPGSAMSFIQAGGLKPLEEFRQGRSQERQTRSRLRRARRTRTRRQPPACPTRPPLACPRVPHWLPRGKGPPVAPSRSEVQPATTPHQRAVSTRPTARTRRRDGLRHVVPRETAPTPRRPRRLPQHRWLRTQRILDAWPSGIRRRRWGQGPPRPGRSDRRSVPARDTARPNVLPSHASPPRSWRTS